MNTNEQRHAARIKLYATDLRRVLYFAQLYSYALEWLMQSEAGISSGMKTNAGNIRNAMKRFSDSVRLMGTPEHWEAINQDLNNDRLHDIALLLEEVANVQNVDEIVEIIHSTKVSA